MPQEWIDVLEEYPRKTLQLHKQRPNPRDDPRDQRMQKAHPNNYRSLRACTRSERKQLHYGSSQQGQNQGRFSAFAPTKNTATGSPIGTKMIGIGPEANESNGTTSAAREAKAYRDSENTRRRRNKINNVHQSVLCGSKTAEILISHLVAELLVSQDIIDRVKKIYLQPAFVPVLDMALRRFYGWKFGVAFQELL